MPPVPRIAGSGLQEGAATVAARRLISNISAGAGSDDCVLSPVYIVTGRSPKVTGGCRLPYRTTRRYL